MNNPNRVLIFDDNADSRALVRDVAEDAGFVVAETGSQTRLAELHAQFEPSVIVLDLGMPGLCGLQYLRELGRLQCAAPIIIIGDLDEKILLSIQHLGRGLGLLVQRAEGAPVHTGALRQALAGAKVPLADRPAWRPAHGEIRNAVNDGELLAYFQPRVNLQHHECPIVGSEALVRWRHPQRGIVPAADFLAAAEATGMISTLTETVLVYVVRQLVRWKKMGLALPVSVNLSPMQLCDEQLPDRAAQMMAEAGLEPGLLGMEISERAARTDLSATLMLLTRLRLKGFAVGIDNFRAASLSLSDIHHLPLGALKLDRGLVGAVERDTDAQTMLRAAVAMARELNVTVCAEGVETASAARLLQCFGCEEAQGFHFGKPQNADEFTSFLKRKQAASETSSSDPFPMYI